MLSEESLSHMCAPRVLHRGRSIAAGGRSVYDRRVRYDGESTIINAVVASQTSSTEGYRVMVELNEGADFVEDYSCTCPAAFQYDGMCKHAVALALDYAARSDSYAGFRRDRSAVSSDCIAAFMERAERLERDDTPDGSVDVLCDFTVEYGEWSMGLRVATDDATYIVKNISDFCRRLDEGTFFEYGKKLAFTHVPSRFTERGRAIVQLVAGIVDAQRRTAPLSSWRYAAPSIGRTMSLSESDMVDVLSALAGETFSIKGADGIAPSVARVRVVDADPEIALAVRPSSRGGFTVERGSRIWLAGRGSKLFVWLGGSEFYRCSNDFMKCADFLRGVYGSEENRPFVAERDMPLFCATALPAIEKRLRVDLPSDIDKYRPVTCSLEFFFDKDKTSVTMRAQAVYGAIRYDLVGELTDRPEPVGVPLPVRDVKREAKARSLAARYFGTGASLALSDGDAVGALLFGGLVEFREAGTVFTTPAFDRLIRDVKREAKARSLAARYFGTGASLALSDGDAVGALLFGGLVEFREAGTVFTTPAFDRLIRDVKPRVTMGVSLSGNLINLVVDAGDLPASELSALLSSYRRRKRYHRLRSGAFIDLKEADLSQLDRLAGDLGLTARELASGQALLPAYRAFYLNEEANLERDRSFQEYIDHFKAVNEADYAVPPTLAGVLRPYQESGFRWLSARCDADFGGVLADEMGLGKSLQLISLLLARHAKRQPYPSLIVCPASLVYNWTAEFERFAPELSVVAVAGGAQERRAARLEAFGGHRRVDVLVTSYDLLRIDIDDWSSHRLFICALDEAQYIKNPAALTTRAVKSLEADHKFALTGTPMENRLSELWSIFDFLMPGLLGPYARFRERFESPIVGGDDAVARRLQAIVAPFMLRRLKADVLTDLPDKLESVVYANMDVEQRKLYDAHEQRLREELTAQRMFRKEREAARAAGKPVSTVEVLAEITRLRQLCCDPRLVYEDYRGPSAKLDAIVDLVSSAVEGGEKTLVFSQFTSFLELIAERLRKAGIAHYSITGATPKKERVRLVDAFNEDDTPAFLVSLKAGGTGLNLTGASVVIHADPWWNAAAQSQATDRAHRIGQTRVVSVEKVVAKNTIEERIVRLQQTKSELADQVVGAGGISLASLDADDLYELLQG